MDCIYLTADRVLDLHSALVELFAAEADPIVPAGVRDEHLLNSACTRPQTSLGDEEKYPSVEEKAGALFHSLVQNHPFYNGNKRTALVATVAFLDANHRRFEDAVPDHEVFGMVTSVASNEFPRSQHGLCADDVVKAIGAWFRERTVSRSAGPSAMRTTDFLERVLEAGGKHKESGGSWVVMGADSSKSVRIGMDTRKLDGHVIQTYLRKLGLSNNQTGIYLEEFQAGITSQGAILVRFRNVLRDLANA